MSRRSLGLLGCAATLASLSGCGPQGSERVDTTPPTITAVVRRNGAEPVPLEGADLLFNSQVVVDITLSEPGIIYSSTDGSEPEPRALGTGLANNALKLSLTDDAVVRWRAVDAAGNTDGQVREGRLRFDFVVPVVTLSPPPPPAGLRLDGPTEVTLTCSEPCALAYTLDNSAPGDGNPRTLRARDTAAVQVVRPVVLNYVAEDAAGNRGRGSSLRYDLDATAPTTAAEPRGGHYLAPVEVSLTQTAAEEGAAIHYTLDGSTPTAASPVVDGLLRVDATTELRFRAIDAAGNAEPEHIERYDFAPLGARPVVDGRDVLHADAAGTFALAAALLDDAGLLSGAEDAAAAYGREVEAWAAGREAISAWMTQGRAGVHGLWSPENIAASTGQGAPPDSNGNGANVDDALGLRLRALADAVGVALPLGVQPLVFPYRGAVALFLRAPDVGVDAAGVPNTTRDYRSLLWQGASGEDRGVELLAVAHMLRALARQVTAGTSGMHASGQGAFLTQIVPPISTRCAGCHRPDGAVPDLSSGAAIRAGFEADPTLTNPLFRALSGGGAHQGVVVPAGQVDAVRRWLEAGAAPDEPGVPEATRPGFSAAEGFEAYLSADQVSWALTWLDRGAGFKPGQAGLGGLTSDEEAWVPSLLRLVEVASVQGLPRRVEAFTVADPVFRLREQTALLRGLVDVAALGNRRAGLFEAPPLAGREGFEAAPVLAARMARHVLEATRTRTLDVERSFWRAQYDPDAGLGPGLSAVSLADFGLTLERVAASDGLGLSGDERAVLRADAGRALAQVEATMKAPCGWLRASATILGTSFPVDALRLEDQLAWLAALAARGAHDDAARTHALELWTRLDEQFWDEGAGTYRSTLGERAVVYDAALAARTLSTLAAVSRLTEAGTLARDAVDARRRRFFDVTVRALRQSETWLSGEVTEAADADGDGVFSAARVPVQSGVAPVFKREVGVE